MNIRVYSSHSVYFVVVQSLSHVRLFATPWTATRQASLSITNSNSFHWVDDAIQPSHPLFSPSPALNLSQHQFFSNESALCIRWPKYWSSVSASVLPMNIQDWSPLGLSGLISLQPKGLSRVFSPTPQFKSINSSALSLLHSPTFTSIHDHRKNHSLD